MIKYGESNDYKFCNYSQNKYNIFIHLFIYSIMTKKKTEKVVETKVTEEIIDPIATTEVDEVVMWEEVTETEVKKTKNKTAKSSKKKKRIIDSDKVDDAVSGAMSSASGAISWLEDNRQQVLGGILILLALYLLREFVFGLILIIAGLLLVTGYFEERD